VAATHIVVVDDDPFQRRTVQEYLARQGFRVTAVEGGSALRRVLKDAKADLVILDVNMPGEDGFTIARMLRAQGGIGIIMLTANADTVDRVVGLETGADDYVTKPFEPRELLARVRSVLRRAGAPRLGAESGHVVLGRCRLDLAARRLVTLDGEEVALTATEFELLKVFAEHPNQVLTRERLLDLASHRDSEPFDRSIDIRITRIRRKIEIDPGKPQAIKTVRGSGYMFVPSAERER
jgi:two-component system, OmpR family, phosphate regulon response regulator OmpR